MPSPVYDFDQSAAGGFTDTSAQTLQGQYESNFILDPALLYATEGRVESAASVHGIPSETRSSSALSPTTTSFDAQRSSLYHRRTQSTFTNISSFSDHPPAERGDSPYSAQRESRTPGERSLYTDHTSINSEVGRHGALDSTQSYRDDSTASAAFPSRPTTASIESALSGGMQPNPYFSNTYRLPNNSPVLPPATLHDQSKFYSRPSQSVATSTMPTAGINAAQSLVNTAGAQPAELQQMGFHYIRDPFQPKASTGPEDVEHAQDGVPVPPRDPSRPPARQDHGSHSNAASENMASGSPEMDSGVPQLPKRDKSAGSQVTVALDEATEDVVTLPQNADTNNPRELAKAFLEHYEQERSKQLDVLDDDVSSVKEEDMWHDFAHQIFDSILGSFDANPGPKYGDGYLKQQNKAMAELKGDLKHKDDQQKVYAHCLLLVGHIIDIHEKGVPKSHFKKRGQTKKKGSRTEMDMKCSVRCRKVIAVTGQNKMIGKDIVEGNHENLVSLARAPDDYLERKLYYKKSNGGRGAVYAAGQKVKRGDALEQEEHEANEQEGTDGDAPDGDAPDSNAFQNNTTQNARASDDADAPHNKSGRPQKPTNASGVPPPAGKKRKRRSHEELAVDDQDDEAHNSHQSRPQKMAKLPKNNKRSRAQSAAGDEDGAGETWGETSKRQKILPPPEQSEIKPIEKKRTRVDRKTEARNAGSSGDSASTFPLDYGLPMDQQLQNVRYGSEQGNHWYGDNSNMYGYYPSPTLNERLTNHNASTVSGDEMYDGDNAYMQTINRSLHTESGSLIGAFHQPGGLSQNYDESDTFFGLLQ